MLLSVGSEREEHEMDHLWLPCAPEDMVYVCTCTSFQKEDGSKGDIIQVAKRKLDGSPHQIYIQPSSCSVLNVSNISTQKVVPVEHPVASPCYRYRCLEQQNSLDGRDDLQRRF